MFFSNKPQLLIHLYREGVSIFGKFEAKFKFPQGLVDNLEVSDEKLLQDSLGSFLASQKVGKTNGICLLDDDILFQKIVPVSDHIDTKAIQQDYASKIPFEPDQTAVIALLNASQLVLIAANKGFYVPIVKAFDNMGCKIETVAPLAIFGRGKLDSKNASSILADSKKAEKANFLQI